MSTEEWLRPTPGELEQAAAVIDRLTPGEQRAMLTHIYSVMCTYQETEDVAQLDRLARDVVGTVHARTSLPGYREALAAADRRQP